MDEATPLQLLGTGADFLQFRKPGVVNFILLKLNYRQAIPGFLEVKCYTDIVHNLVYSEVIDVKREKRGSSSLSRLSRYQINIQGMWKLAYLLIM